MAPIKLTDNHYINPSCVAEVEFRPKSQYQVNASFFAAYENSDLGSLQLLGDEAEEAFKSWTTAIAAQANKEPLTATASDE